MEKVDTAFLAGIQKSNGLDAHQRHAIEVQLSPSPITI